MSGSVLIVDRSAARAAFARVSGIDKNHRHASTSRFVCDELTKLAKRPVAQACSPTATGRNPATNVLEVFKTNRPAGAFCGFDKLFRNAVVDVFLEAGLLAREFTETALGRLGAALLKTRSTAEEIGADFLDGFARVALAIAVGRDIRDAEIDTKSLKRVDQFWVINVADAGEIEVAAHVHQIDFALTEGKQVALVLPHHSLDLDAAFEGPDGNDVVGLKADYPVVVGLSGVLAERDLRRFSAVGLVRRVGIGNLGNAADSGLGSKSELGACHVVSDLVQVELARFSDRKTNLREAIAGLVATLKRVQKELLLLLGRFQLDVCDQLHSSNIEHPDQISIPSFKKGRAFLRWLNPAVSCAQES